MIQKPCFAGACTWRNILYRLQVWNLSPIGGQIMRAADCKNLSESPEGVFRQSEAPAFHRGLLCYVKFSFRLTSQWVRKYPPTATIRNSPAFHSIMEEKTSMPLD